MKIYACIDLKSFYASVECRERGLDPLNTNLVVADEERTEKTICLAITPPLKEYGLKGRARLFEVKEKVKEINKEKIKQNNYKKFTKKSYLKSEIETNKSLEMDFIIAKPHMQKYIDISVQIYSIYLKYLSKEDIYVYSIDEVFCDITNYLKLYNLMPKDLISKIIKEIYEKTGITATAGIGPNLYLAKVSMDILAKHIKPNEIGGRIAEVDEMTYRKLLWDHKPLTDFWRIGKGIAKKLEENNMHTMGDIAKTSLENENLLFKLFGVNAELIIDHAWGFEPVTMKDIKEYKPKQNSISKGQVLHCAYSYEKAKIIIKEMADALALSLTEKSKVTKQIVLYIEYDIENLKNNYQGQTINDHYGRKIPKPAHGKINLDYYTSSSKIIIQKSVELYEKITNKNLLIKKLNITACDIQNETITRKDLVYEQLDLFNTLNNKLKNEKENQNEDLKLQKTILNLKNKYGKNSILKAMDYLEESTAKDRNNQIGGHRK